MARQKKPRRSIFVRLLAIGVAIYMISTLVGLYNQLQESMRQYAEVRQQIDEKKLEKAELTELLNEDSEAALIEKTARERLDYGFPYETYYVAE